METKKLDQSINLDELLRINNITKIQNVRELFDINDLDSDKMPKILVTKASIIIIDNSIFNTTYLIDLFNEFINKNQNSDTPIDLNEINIYYLDSIVERLKIANIDFSFDIDKLSEMSESEIENIEKSQLAPSIIFLNPNINHMGIVNEGWIPICQENVNSLFALVDSNRLSLATDRKSEVLKELEEK